MPSIKLSDLKQHIIASGHPLGEAIVNEEQRIAQRIAEDRRRVQRQNIAPVGAPITAKQRAR